ncbi:hypothetical protein RHGRI_003756 [Rhododendron griersonianum]|uniref:Uncharacterized protein n=1 Tax=Rhododendron griersonianum TaxID=479676 RepID=A0AAV6L7C7_9ERIC|nr:hypothetical protein RHGRI_003756 [Rhododendron griersonianum]
MTGTLVTMPFLSTQTQTLVQSKFKITEDPSFTIWALTRGFSLSIVVSAVFPWAPTSSGHELLPT